MWKLFLSHSLGRKVARVLSSRGSLACFVSFLVEAKRFLWHDRQPQHFAGRWAAKEAVLKALGTGWVKGIGWRDIEIHNLRGGQPIVKLRGGARDVVERSGIGQMLISISHCRSHATAFAIALAAEEEASPSDGDG